jgi:hypothetical protein
VYDTSDTTGRNASITSSAITGLAPASITYAASSFNFLNFFGGSGTNTFTVDNAPLMTLSSGTGQNTYNVLATNQPLTIEDNTTGPNIDTINVGNAGSVQSINALLSVFSGNSTNLTQMVVDDSADPTGRTATLSKDTSGEGLLGGMTSHQIFYDPSKLALLTVRTGTGTNTLTVDSSGGNPIPLSGLDFHGGTGSNTLNLQGGTFATEDYSANGPGAGSINLAGSAINFTGLSPINDTTTATNFSFDAPSTASLVNIVDGPTVANVPTTQINGVSPTGGPGFELVNFANKANVTVNALGQVPTTVTLNNPTTATGLASLSLSTGSSGATINVPATPASVPTSITTRAGTNVINVTALGLGAGLSVTGGGTSNTLNVDAGGNLVNVTATTISIDSLPVITLANVPTVHITNAADHPITGDLPTLIISPNGVLTNTVVGSFSDADPAGQTTNFTADINWGDGTPDTLGTITQPGGPGTTFNIVASHTFIGGGVFPVVVTVMDHGNSGTQVLGGTTFTITDGGGSSTLTGSVVEAPIIATAGVPFTRTVFSFIPPNGLVIPPSAVTATINWGDGTTPSRVQGMAGTFPNSIVISASHTYASPGNYTINVVASAFSFSVPFQLSAIVSGSNVITGTGTTITETAGQSFTSPVATFTDTNSSIPASGFTASIGWGDGTSSTGSVVELNSSVGPAGGFAVIGTHTYTEAGTFFVDISVSENPPGTASAPIDSTAIVLSPQFSGVTLSLNADQAFSGSVGSFTDTLPPNTPGRFFASIDWGDGTSATPGTVTATGTDTYTVLGSHTYTQDGLFHIGVSIIDPLERPILGSSTAIVGLVVTNTNDAGPGSLRFVLNEVNLLGGGTVRFDIPGPAPHVISIGSDTGLPLPPVTSPNVIIDARTQPGYQGKPLVVINGASAPADANGLTFEGGYDAVYGTVIDDFGDVGVALEVHGFDIVEGNYIGTDDTGTAPDPNFQGIVIFGTSGNLIGSSAPGGGNVISGNTSAGIQILNNATVFDSVDLPPAPLQFTSAMNNAIQNNLIGTTADGTKALPNQQGIFINDASFNLVGGDTPGTGNLIAHNTSIAVQILGDHATSNVVLSNTIRDNGRGVFVYSLPGNVVIQPGVAVTTRALSDGPNVQTAVPFLNPQGQVAGIVVVFTMYMDRTLVENVNEYVVALLGRKNAFDPVASAVYDNPDRLVVLGLQTPLPTSQLYQLRILGTAPGGLTDRVGPPDWLDGNLLLPRIPTGSSFVGTFQGTTAIANPNITNPPKASGKKVQKAVRKTRTASHPHPHPHPKPSISSKAVDALLTHEGGIRVHPSARKSR